MIPPALFDAVTLPLLWQLEMVLLNKPPAIPPAAAFEAIIMLSAPQFSIVPEA